MGTSSCMHLVWICVISVSMHTNTLVEGRRISAPAFQTVWMPIKNGLTQFARIDVPHGLNEVPILVDVSVKVDDNIFPASGFRPDHPVEMAGPVVYIYNDKFVNVSTSPNTDTLHQVIPTSTNFYSGYVRHWNGPVYVRVRAWTRSSLPVPDFETSGILFKAKTGSVSDSYAEKAHGINKVPLLVVTRAKMSHPTDNVAVYADAVGSSMVTYTNVAGMTNAYLVHGYNSSHIRIWVDASPYGAIFDGRKHTWFDFVIYDAEVEIFAWSMSTLTPVDNQLIQTVHTAGNLPSWWHADTDNLEHSLVRIMTVAEDESGANTGYLFPASMHLAYPADNVDGSIIAEIGGLSYSYQTTSKIEFWKPHKSAKSSMIFIGSTFGNGHNTESSNSESVFAINWLPEENSKCQTPIIYKAIIDGVQNETTQNTTTRVECMSGYHLVKSSRSYLYRDELEPNTIKCDKYGVWVNVPTCQPNEKELGEICSPAEDTCNDELARCTLSADQYHCQCVEGYKAKDSRCIKVGTFLSEPDFDSGWVTASLSSNPLDIRLEHMLGEIPIFVDARIRVEDYVFPLLGFRPDSRDDIRAATTVFIYDNQYINVTALQNGFDKRLVSIHNTRWTGWSTQWGRFGYIRVRAWKANSLPDPDFINTSTQLRANTSGPDSFAEVFHDLGEYPGLIVVRAKMMQNDKIFFAHGLGSALNVFYNESGLTNSYLVYGFNDESVRMWVDSSKDGVIFDGRKTTLFNFTVSEAEVEIFAWKVSSITPYFTHNFPLHDYDVPNDIQFETSYRLSEEINMVWVEIDENNSVHKGYRFPGSTFLAMRFYRMRNISNDNCVFGGFMYGLHSTRDRDRVTYKSKMNIYKPDPGDRRDYIKGSTVCVPNTFGRGQKTGSASNGVGIIYSWVNPDCGTPTIEHAHVDTSENGTYIGAVAMVTCNEGYHAAWKQFIKCDNEDKTWSSSTCIIDKCTLPNTPDNGKMTDNGNGHFGDNMTFTCDDGFKLIGSEVLLCEAGGVWSDELPHCKCILPSPPVNGKYTVDGNGNFGDNITFTCYDGFVLNGSEVLQCGAGGEPPSCKRKATSGSSGLSASATICLIQMLSMLLLTYI